MIKRRLLSYDIPQLTKVFKKDFPQLVTMAEESESAALFKEALRSFVFSRIDRTVGGSNMGNAVAKRILLLIEHDGMMVSELSTGEEMPVRTITCLWQFLAGKLEEDVSPDFFIDLYQQFELLVQVDKEVRRNIFLQLPGQELPQAGNRPYRHLLTCRKLGDHHTVMFDQQKNTLRHGISHIAPANRPVDAGKNKRAQGFFKKRCALTLFRHRYQLGKIFFKYFCQLRNVVR